MLTCSRLFASASQRSLKRRWRRSTQLMLSVLALFLLVMNAVGAAFRWAFEQKKTPRPAQAYRNMVPLLDEDVALIERLLERVYYLVAARSEGISLTSLCERVGLSMEATDAAVEQLEELGFTERSGSLVKLTNLEA